MRSGCTLSSRRSTAVPSATAVATQPSTVARAPRSRSRVPTSSSATRIAFMRPSSVSIRALWSSCVPLAVPAGVPAPRTSSVIQPPVWQGLPPRTSATWLRTGPLAPRRRWRVADGELYGWRSNEPELDRAHRRLGAIGDAKFGDNLADVELDRAHADVERAGNRAVGLSLRHQPQHRLLTRGQLVLG